MSTLNGSIGMSGALGRHVTRMPRADGKWALAWRLKQFFRYGWREVPLALFVLSLPVLRRIVPGLVVLHSRLELKIIRSNGDVIDLGTIGRHLITTAGKNAVASTFDNTIEPEIFKYHGFGTGTTAAAIGDTALQTEGTTAYATDNTRPTGSQAHSSATYTTVATHTPDAAQAVTEWGLFSQASNAGGTLLDRQVFSAVNLNGSGDSLQTTYVLTIS